MVQQKRASSAASVLLLAVTVVVVALAFGLGAFALGSRQAVMLQQEGFLHWGGSALADDVGIDFLNSPVSSIWYYYQPGGQLDFAFIYAPVLRGVVSGMGMFVGAAFIALSVVAWGRMPGLLRIPTLIVIWGALAAACLPMVVEPPASFGADAQKATVTDAVLQPGDIVALATVSGFGVGYVPGRFWAGHSVIFASRKDGTTFTLTELNGTAEAAPLVNLLQNFVSTKGKQL